ncbi:hypothetical protein AYL99_11871 [Fonsecaea erecta]|uniref:Uncharacterized protein n=1 Tax=Fonsecaea erecta TaxID=1367422 RepID=A0A178Z223_9EURO|nr:hypothetical protein AYL99_11871 [Fonsecaea erecta]OAP53849.1 hypothetical protein AYL99_11871 [Fonsecaea erecta]
MLPPHGLSAQKRLSRSSSRLESPFEMTWSEEMVAMGESSATIPQRSLSSCELWSPGNQITQPEGSDTSEEEESEEEEGDVSFLLIISPATIVHRRPKTFEGAKGTGKKRNVDGDLVREAKKACRSVGCLESRGRSCGRRTD